MIKRTFSYALGQGIQRDFAWSLVHNLAIERYAKLLQKKSSVFVAVGGRVNGDVQALE